MNKKYWVSLGVLVVLAGLVPASVMVMKRPTQKAAVAEEKKDTNPPTVTINYPVNGAVLTGNTTVNITAYPIDNTGISKVEFYVSGSTKCVDTTAPYNCAWNVPAKKAGYVLVARAYDGYGNNAVSGAVSVTVK